MKSNYNSIKNKLGYFEGFIKSIWFEYKALVQNKGVLYSNIVFPIVYYIFFVRGLGSTIGVFKYNSKELDYVLYAMTGLMGIICVGELTNVVYRTIIDNKWGLLHMKLLNGINPLSYCLSKSFYAIIGINIQIPILLIITYLTCKIGILNIFIGYLMCIVICLFWVNLGIIIALKITSYKVRDFIIGVLLLPIYFSAPAYYILDDVDILIKTIAYINPLTYQLMGLREAMLFLNFNLDVIITILMTVTLIFVNILLLNNINFNRNEV